MVQVKWKNPKNKQKPPKQNQKTNKPQTTKKNPKPETYGAVVNKVATLYYKENS